MDELKKYFIFFTFLMNVNLVVNAQERCVVEDSITVYVFMLEDCLITQFYTPQLRNLYEEYFKYNIDFVGLFPNKYSKPEKIDSFKTAYQIPFPLKTDYYKSKTRLMDAKVTPEVCVYNHDFQEIIYKGRIDNAYYKVGKKRGVTNTSELRDVLEAIVKGEPVQTPNTEAVGCLIN